MLAIPLASPRTSRDITLGHAVDAYLTILRGAEQANRVYGRILRAMATEFGSDTAPDDTASDRLDASSYACGREMEMPRPWLPGERLPACRCHQHRRSGCADVGLR